MTFYIYVSWPNHVPAVAVTRGRLVLFIFNRFKGYLDSKSSSQRGLIYTRVLCERGCTDEWSDEILWYHLGTDKGESDLLCINWRWGTKAWGTNRIRYPSSSSRQLWMPYTRLNLVYKWKCKHSTSRVMWQRRNWNH